jgi:fatty acid desaturase
MASRHALARPRVGERVNFLYKAFDNRDKNDGQFSAPGVTIPPTRDIWLRKAIRSALPPSTFRPIPRRILFAIPLVGAIVLLSALLILTELPVFARILMSIALGNTYGALMFFAHEVAHGATVKSKRLQDGVLYLACTLFCFSPHLWRVWHNTVHHSHTNDPSRDPDHFGTVEQFFAQKPSSRRFVKLAPGMSLLSLAYLFVFFSLQAQFVLWLRKRELQDFKSLRRIRASIDGLAMVCFWIALTLSIGLHLALYVVIIPFFIANFVVLSYVLTNHLLMPLMASDTLKSTMSVRTLRFLDKMHFHFSHHVEHHLFPSMPSSHYWLVRRFLTRNYFQLYAAPAHWRALLAIFASPRIYETNEVLCNPFTHRRQHLIETHARWLKRNLQAEPMEASSRTCFTTGGDRAVTLQSLNNRRQRIGNGQK